LTNKVILYLYSPATVVQFLIGTSLGLRTFPGMCKYLKGLPKYLAFGLTWDFPHMVQITLLGRCDTKLDAQMTFAHSPKVISRTKGVDAH
jgi:hypothetical protein